MNRPGGAGPDHVAAIARRLVQSYRQHAPVRATPASGPAHPEAAYAVQQAVWQAMAGCERPRAWKVGASARDAVPTAAPVFPSRLAAGPARYPAGLFMAPGIEAEIALRFGQDLPPRPDAYSRGEILAAIEGAYVAMEIVDTRLADPEAAGPHWRLADNLLNGALVLGEPIPHWRDLDWADQHVQVMLDGEALPGLTGRPPLDDLFHCLPWWLAHVGGARTGDIVTTGAWSGMHPAAQATRLAVLFTGLGGAEAVIG